MPKQIIFDEEARRSLKMGVDVLSEALKVTLGPRGRRVVLEMVEEFIDTVQRLDALVNEDEG